MKRFIWAFFLFVIFAVTEPLYGQNFRQEFKALFDRRDFNGQERVLRQWESASPDDPELFVSYFNYFFLKSRNETISLTREPAANPSVAVKKDGDDKVVAYLGSNITYTKSDIDTGLVYIERGIAKNPDRLDMRFGKTYVLGQIRDFARFTEEILKTIERANSNKNKWLWAEGKPVERPKEMMLSSIQDYVVQLFNADDKDVNFIKPIAESVLRYYPDHIESMSNLAVFHMFNKEYDPALVWLLKAEAIAPSDHVIVGNIAFCYFNKRDRANAVKYYERLKVVGDSQAKEFASAKLAEIKKW